MLDHDSTDIRLVEVTEASYLMYPEERRYGLNGDELNILEVNEADLISMGFDQASGALRVVVNSGNGNGDSSIVLG